MLCLPDAFINYMVQFHATRDLFECHELLEEHWKNEPKDGYADTWVGLIQLAVGLYHERRGNWRGAAKLLADTEGRLAEVDLQGLGLNKSGLLEMIALRRIHIEEQEQREIRDPYIDFDIPIERKQLLDICLERCTAMQLQWGISSSELEPYVLSRHVLRDRSDVITARLEALREKQRQTKEAQASASASVQQDTVTTE